MNLRRSRLIGSVAHHSVAIVLSVLFVLPLVWMLSGSLREAGLPPPRGIEWLPEPLAVENYSRLFGLLPFALYTLNSLLVATIAVPLTLLVASWAGFAMARLDSAARQRLLLLSVGVLMIPSTALWLTRYLVLDGFGLINTYGALLAPALMGTSPLFVLLFYWSFRRVPADIFDSAQMDGASPLRTWWSVAMPLAGPTILAVGVLSWLFYWSDFMGPLLYLKSQALYTLPVGLQQLRQLDSTNWPLLLAGAVVMTVPPVVLFLVAQRWLLRTDRPAGLPLG